MSPEEQRGEDLPDDWILLQAHVEALFTIDPDGQLLSVNEPEGGPAPRFFLGCTTHRARCWFRQDVSRDEQRALTDALATTPAGMDITPPDNPGGGFTTILARRSPIQRIWAGPAFRFPGQSPDFHHAVLITPANASLLHPHLEAWLGDVGTMSPMLAIVVDGAAVSLCASVRRTALAHEAGVETALAFRARGYGAATVRAWAAAVVRLGGIPLYSTSWSNEASRSLARSLDLRQFATDLHIT